MSRAMSLRQLLAHLDDFLRHLRRARDRLDHRQLALLDALRDCDFAFAREERHGAHLAQVHADRVTGPRVGVLLVLVDLALLLLLLDVEALGRLVDQLGDDPLEIQVPWEEKPGEKKEENQGSDADGDLRIVRSAFRECRPETARRRY